MTYSFIFWRKLTMQSIMGYSHYDVIVMGAHVLILHMFWSLHAFWSYTHFDHSICAVRGWCMYQFVCTSLKPLSHSFCGMKNMFRGMENVYCGVPNWAARKILGQTIKKVAESVDLMRHAACCNYICGVRRLF